MDFSLIDCLCGHFGCYPYELRLYLDLKDRSFLQLFKKWDMRLVGTTRQVRFAGLSNFSARKQPLLPRNGFTVEADYAINKKYKLNWPEFPCIACTDLGKVEFFPLEVLYVRT